MPGPFAREETATIEYTVRDSEQTGVPVPCVFATCMGSNDSVGPIWGHGDNSVKRALSELTGSCGCGATWHEAGDEVRDEPSNPIDAEGELGQVESRPSWMLSTEEIETLKVTKDPVRPEPKVQVGDRVQVGEDVYVVDTIERSVPESLTQAVEIVKELVAEIKNHAASRDYWECLTETERKEIKRAWAKRVRVVLERRS